MHLKTHRMKTSEKQEKSSDFTESTHLGNDLRVFNDPNHLQQ